MKVLLIETVPNLGKAGEIKEVPDGYARNFLLPRGLATAATASAVKQAATTKQAEQKRAARVVAERQELARKLNQTEVVFKARVGEQHRLFGSITASDIADELSRKVGQDIDKRDIELSEPLRHLGTFKVPIRLGPKLIPNVTVVVESETT